MPDLAVENTSVLDVGTGGMLSERTVLIRGNRIVRIAPTRRMQLRPGTLVVDGRGKYILPGFWDMHAHALGADREPTFLPALVAHGVTGVRNMHTLRPLAEVRALKEAILLGRTIGPRVVAAGPLVDGPHQYNHRGAVVVGSPEAAIRAVDSLAAAGADFIKVYEALSPEVYSAIAAQAKNRKLPFAGHIPRRVPPATAAAFGQNSVEHLAGLMEPCSSVGGAACDSVIRAFASHRTWQVPTLGLYWSRRVADSLLADPSRTVILSPERLTLWRSMSERATRADRERWEAEYRTSLSAVRRLNQARVPILVGTDMPNPLVLPGVSVHDELWLLTQAGLTPLQAIQAATSRAAEYLDAADSLGSVRAGALADLVLLEGNPIEDIRNTRRIAAVVLNGRYLDRRHLDQLLKDAAAAAQAPKP